MKDIINVGDLVACIKPDLSSDFLFKGQHYVVLEFGTLLPDTILVADARYMEEDNSPLQVFIDFIFGVPKYRKAYETQWYNIKRFEKVL